MEEPQPKKSLSRPARRSRFITTSIALVFLGTAGWHLSAPYRTGLPNPVELAAQTSQMQTDYEGNELIDAFSVMSFRHANREFFDNNPATGRYIQNDALYFSVRHMPRDMGLSSLTVSYYYAVGKAFYQTMGTPQQPLPPVRAHLFAGRRHNQKSYHEIGSFFLHSAPLDPEKQPLTFEGGQSFTYDIPTIGNEHYFSLSFERAPFFSVNKIKPVVSRRK